MTWNINIGDTDHQYQEQLYILTSNLTTYSPIMQWI